MSEITRRQVLCQLAATIASAGIIDRAAAQEVHHMAGQAIAAAGGTYTPTALSRHEFATVERLCDLILPVENGAPGALAADVPAWIDTIAGASDRVKSIYTKGVPWLDDAMKARGAERFIAATAAQQTGLLDVIAYRRNTTPELAPGIEFFTWVRRMTVDGFYTSRVGMRDVYLGNTASSSFVVPPDAIGYALERSGL